MSEVDSRKQEVDWLKFSGQIQKLTIPAMSRLELPNPRFPALTKTPTWPCEWLSSTLQPLSHRPKVTCLFLPYPYFHWNFHGNSWVPPFQTVTAKILDAISKSSNYPHSLHIPLLRSKFHSYSCFPRTVALRNRLPRGCLLDNLFSTTCNFLALTNVFPCSVIHLLKLVW